MFSRALICSDLSEASFRLVGCAGQLKPLGVSEVVLVHAVNVFEPNARLITDGDDRLVEQARMMAQHGITVSVDMPAGHPSFSLREAADRFGVDLTLVAASGKGLFGAPFSGSVSSDVVLMSGVPVLVSSERSLGGEDACQLVCAQLLRKVLLCTDFSSAAECAFETVTAMARAGLAEAHVVHVQDPSPDGSCGGADAPHLSATAAEAAVELLAERLRRSGVPSVTAGVLAGRPTQVIPTLASAGTYSLVVLGSHGRDRSELVMGGVSDRTVRAATVPVLLVPPRRPAGRSAA